MSDKKVFWLVLFIGVIFTASYTIAATLAPVRMASRVTLSLTPQAIGDASGREELVISVDSDAANPVFCGYSSSTLSQTPGPGSGFRYAPGAGRVVCKYPDRPLYCIGDGSVLSFDEAYAKTPTATATATATNTPA